MKDLGEAVRALQAARRYRASGSTLAARLWVAAVVCLALLVSYMVLLGL